MNPHGAMLRGFDTARAQDATFLAAAIGSGETAATAVMRASLARIAGRADLGAVRRVDAEMGLAHAEACDRQMGKAPRAQFAGVPLLMKDLGNAAAGLAPVAGSPALLKRMTPPADDSELVRRFRGAGLIPFGLTTTPEFGLALSSEPPTGPVAKNPWNLALTPGGSSGGAAAAVAAGLVAMAHATDAAGSIRVPAACCGLVGLKPTRGATPNGPAFNNHLMGLAGELVLARSVRDVQSVLMLCTGKSQGPSPDPELGANPAGVGLRIGVVDSAPGMTGIGREQVEAIASAADLFERHGHRILRIDADRLAGHAMRSNSIARKVLSVSLAGWLDSFSVQDAEISALASATANEGRRLSAAALFAADRDGVLIAHALWRLFETVDAVITPVLSAAPPAIGAFPTDHEDVATHFARMAALAPYAALANVGGIPALSVPHGSDCNGLPLAIQLAGPMGAEVRLLELAAILERGRPWSYPWSIAGTAA